MLPAPKFQSALFYSQYLVLPQCRNHTTVSAHYYTSHLTLVPQIRAKKKTPVTGTNSHQAKGQPGDSLFCYMECHLYQAQVSTFKLFRLTCPKPIKPTYSRRVKKPAHLNKQSPP